MESRDCRQSKKDGCRSYRYFATDSGAVNPSARRMRPPHAPPYNSLPHTPDKPRAPTEHCCYYNVRMQRLPKFCDHCWRKKNRGTSDPYPHYPATDDGRLENQPWRATDLPHYPCLDTAEIRSLSGNDNLNSLRLSQASLRICLAGGQPVSEIRLRPQGPGTLRPCHGATHPMPPSSLCLRSWVLNA